MLVGLRFDQLWRSTLLGTCDVPFLILWTDLSQFHRRGLKHLRDPKNDGVLIVRLDGQ